MENSATGNQHAEAEGGCAQGQNEEKSEEGHAAKSINPLTLPYVALSELRYLPTSAGIYFVIEEGGEVTYIGQSLNIRRRWHSHHVQDNLCDPSDLDAARRVRLAWLEVTDVAALADLERQMIQRFLPRLNDTYTRQPRTAGPLHGSVKERKFMTAREFCGGNQTPVPNRGVMATKRSDTGGDFHSIWQDARLANPPKRFRDLHASQNRETEESGHQESCEGEEDTELTWARYVKCSSRSPGVMSV